MSLPRKVTNGPSQVHLAKVQSRLKNLRETLQAIIPETVTSITWEIGCGHGHFLVEHASAHPSRFFVGIDLLSDRLRKASRKQQIAGVENVMFVKAEAEEFLECVPDHVHFDEVLILFPDPWPKKRHHKNRLIQTGFLDSLAPRMLPAGSLYFRTDHEPYLEWAREKVGNHPRWAIDPNAPWVLEVPTVFQEKATSFGSLVARIKTPSTAEKTAG